MRKLKKVYFTTSSLIFALSPYFESLLPKGLENLIASKDEIRFFYHNECEIDFLIENEKIIAIEVKSEPKKLEQLKKFAKDKNFSKKLEKCIIIDLEKEGKENGIEIISAWKFEIQEFFK